MEAIRTTAAARAFTDEEVPDSAVRAILDAARYAPSGGNRQPWRVVVVKDRAVRARLRDLMRSGFLEYAAHVDIGVVPFAPGPDGRWHGPAVDLERARESARSSPFIDSLERAPVVLVIAADLTKLAVLDNGLNRQSIVGGASIYPFVHNVLLAARGHGLGGVMTTFLCREEPAARELLHMTPNLGLASVVVLGYPSQAVTRLRRLPVESFTTLDSFGGRPFAAPD